MLGEKGSRSRVVQVLAIGLPFASDKRTKQHQACHQIYSTDNFLFLIMQTTAAATMQISVLTGVKEQCALYPSRQSLPAGKIGRTLLMAASVKSIASMSRSRYPFFLSFIECFPLTFRFSEPFFSCRARLLY